MPQEALDRVISLALRASPRALEAFYRELTTADFRDELPRHDLPVLVIQGDRDATAPLELTGRPTAALVPGARLLVYEGAPHSFFDRAFGEWAEACDDAWRHVLALTDRVADR